MFSHAKISLTEWQDDTQARPVYRPTIILIVLKSNLLKRFQSFKVSLITKITYFIEVQQLHYTFNELIWQSDESKPSRTISVSHNSQTNGRHC